MELYIQTNQFKWFRVEENTVTGEKPLAQINSYVGPQWFCLKQRWVSIDGEYPDEWRDIEVVL